MMPFIKKIESINREDRGRRIMIYALDANGQTITIKVEEGSRIAIAEHNDAPDERLQ